MDINDFGRRNFITWTTGLKERIQEAEKKMQMRPYRGLTKEGKLVYGWYKYHPYYALHLICFFEENEQLDGGGIWKEIEVIPETVGQFTGLKDKNGKDVFVGDEYIKHDTYSDQLGTIIFDEQDLQYKVHFPLTNHKAQIRLDRNLEKAENILRIY